MIPTRNRIAAPGGSANLPGVIERWGLFEDGIHLALSYVVFLGLSLFLTALVGVPLNEWIVGFEIIFISLFFVQFTPRGFLKSCYQNKITIGIFALATIVYSLISQFFSTITWDGALFLLNAKMFITGTPILNAYYKPLTWSAILTPGLNFGIISVIPILACLLVVMATYLFAKSLTQNRKVAQLSALISIFTPLLLLWGLSYYAETYLLFLLAFGFANYFQYNNTGKKFYYVMSMILFSLAFLTKYSTGIIFIIPLYDTIKNRKLLFSWIPPVVIIGIFLLYQYAKARDPLYAFTLYSRAVEGATNNLFSNTYYFEQMNSIFTWPLLLAGIIGVILLFFHHHRKNMVAFLGISAIMVGYMLLFLRLKDVRYFVFLIPLIVTAAGYALFFAGNLSQRINITLQPRVITTILTVILLACLLVNYSSNIYPQYKYTGKNIALEAADFVQRMDSTGNVAVMSNSHVIMSWYLQRKVWGGVPIENLSENLIKNNIQFIVNFEHSGTPAEMKNTKLLLPYAKIIQTYTDGHEKINILEVET